MLREECQHVLPHKRYESHSRSFLYNVDSPRPPLGQGSHQLIQKLPLFIRRHLWPSATQVQRVLDQCLVARAQVKHEWQGSSRRDTSTSGVQCQLADWNAHAIDTEIAETENTAAIRDDGDFDIARPILDDGVEVSFVREGQVHACIAKHAVSAEACDITYAALLTLWLRVDLRPALAGFTNSGRVDQWCQFLFLASDRSSSPLLFPMLTLTLLANRR